MLSFHSTLQRAQDLANVTAYREWVLFGYLVCPDELRRVTSIDIALVYFMLYTYIAKFLFDFATCGILNCLLLLGQKHHHVYIIIEI